MARLDPSTWSVDEVVAQTCDRSSELYSKIQIKPILNLKTLEQALRANDIDGEALLSLEDANVKDDLGVTSFGQRREIRKIIQRLRQHSSIYTSSPEPQTKRPHEDTEPETSGNIPEFKKRRRIQPENLSAQPLRREIEPEEDELEGHWLDLLERYPNDSDDEGLRPYGQSDTEKELSSDDSLGDELEEQEASQEPNLSIKAVNQAIDETIQDFRDTWAAEKKAKKHKTALRRWLQAAKARTRKPQQNALHRELEQYQTRLAKFRNHISDTAREYTGLEEVKRNCLNLQATVEDMMEREYYLEILASERPPERPPQQVVSERKVALLPDEESLKSSSDDEDESNEGDTTTDTDSADIISLASDNEMSLPYDPVDDDWHPVIPSPEFEGRSGAIGVSQLPKLPLLAETVPPLHQSSNNTTPMLVESPILRAELPVGTHRRLPSQERPAAEIQSEPLMPLDDDDSDMDRFRLPRSRYTHQGETADTAIVLGSSPSASGSEHMLTDHSIRTPPLNPVTLSKTTPQPKNASKYQWPDIESTRNMKWTEVGKNNPFLALCKIVYRHKRSNAQEVLEHIRTFTIHETPQALRAVIAEIQDVEDDQIDEIEEEAPIIWAFFFIVFATMRGYRSIWDVSEEMLDTSYEATHSKALEFDRILKPLLKHYIATKTANGPVLPQDSSTPQPSTPQPRLVSSGSQSNHSDSHLRPTYQTSMPSTGSETEVEATSSKKKRKRPVQQSQEVLAQQRDDRSRVEAQEERRLLMMQKFQSQVDDGDARQVLVNTEEPLIYLDHHIARRIKEHQITGVQFIWRELIEDQKHQGCLLAHTMGLGKTMQVISFLVTLAQANRSPDAMVRQLIPESLRSKKVLIICPASLVDNWYDEILMWTPPQDPYLLGGIYKIGSSSRAKKIDTVREWDREPGILLISYESFRSLLRGRSKNQQESEWLTQVLLDHPSVVVADEAHKLKNARSSINRVSQLFTTSSRVALTGSPLNNHLEEYHTMIDWIAPGYLGTLPQFRDKYSEPIQQGLYEDSTRYEKRRSLNKLYILKRDLAPKIDRKDISAIAADMPQKTEFFITVPLTDIQKQIYTQIVQHILAAFGSISGITPKSSNAQLWSWLSILSWLNNHPACLIRKLQENDAVAYQNAMDSFDGDEDTVIPADIDLRDTPLAAMLTKFLECFKGAGAQTPEDLNDPSWSIRALVSRQLILESIAAGEKILLFSHSIPTLDFLESMLQHMDCAYLRIDGSTRTDQRQAQTKIFNEGTQNHMVFLISTRAGGLGLNLQGANRVIIYDFGFNPSWEEQAIGRAYRLGQKKAVFVYRFCAGGTFEETIRNKSIFKTQLFSRVVDQKNVVRHASKKVEDYIFAPRDVARDERLEECLGKDELLDRVVQLAPDSIRNLVLTETFQREDETDELTAEEQRLADKEVEMARLERIDPLAFLKKKQEEDEALRRQEQATKAKEASNAQAQDNISKVWFPHAFNPAAHVASGGMPMRNDLNESTDTLSSAHVATFPLERGDGSRL